MRKRPRRTPSRQRSIPDLWTDGCNDETGSRPGNRHLETICQRKWYDSRNDSLGTKDTAFEHIVVVLRKPANWSFSTAIRARHCSEVLQKEEAARQKRPRPECGAKQTCSSIHGFKAKKCRVVGDRFPRDCDRSKFYSTNNKRSSATR